MNKLEIYKNPKNFSLVSSQEIPALMNTLDLWKCVDDKCLKKKYVFNSYQEGWAFVDAAAQFAENVNHHPQLLLGFKFVEVNIWTHNVDGLSRLDFALAQDLDWLASKITGPKI